MYSLPYSGSSHLMSYITTFRNLHGKEYWRHQNVIDQKIIPNSFYIKVAVAELGFGCVAITALVETAAYAVFMVISMPVFHLSKKPARWFHMLLDSSKTSLEWAVKSLYNNLVKHNLPICEPLTESRAIMIEHNSLIQQVNQLIILRNQLEFLIKKGSPVLGANEGLKILQKILENPKNVNLKIDLKSVISPNAIVLLSYLTIVECLLKNEPNLSFLCKEAQDLIRSFYKNNNFIEKLNGFIKRNENYFDLLNFSRLEKSKLENANDVEIYLKIKAISGIAIQGSFLFCDILYAYIPKG